MPSRPEEPVSCSALLPRTQSSPAPTPPDRYWLDSAEKIRLLQSLLREVGTYDGAVTGELTYNTRGALAAYCAARGLPDMDPSGKWVPGETMAALRNAILQQRTDK